MREPLVKTAVALQDASVGPRVDLVNRVAQRRQAAGEERLVQSLGCQRQVGQHAEAAEALAEHAPAVDLQRPADALGVAHDRVGTKMGQILGLLGRGHARERSDRGRAAGAALIQQQDAVLAQRMVKPTRRARAPRRPHGLKPRAALQEDEERPIGPVRIGDLTSEHLDGLSARINVVERHLDRVLDADQPRDSNFGAHPSIMHRSARSERGETSDGRQNGAHESSKEQADRSWPASAPAAARPPPSHPPTPLGRC